MVEPERPWPRLEFSNWHVPFPEKGQHLFLRGEDLTQPQKDAPGDAVPGVWLFRAESGVCGIIPAGVKVRRRGVRIVGLAVLHHGDRIEVESHEATFLELRRMKLAADSHLVGRPCPYCHTPHAAHATVYRCPLCGEAYCEDCWLGLESKRCCSRDCRYSPGRLQEL